MYDLFLPKLMSIVRLVFSVCQRVGHRSNFIAVLLYPQLLRLELCRDVRGLLPLDIPAVLRLSPDTYGVDALVGRWGGRWGGSHVDVGIRC